MRDEAQANIVKFLRNAADYGARCRLLTLQTAAVILISAGVISAVLAGASVAAGAGVGLSAGSPVG